jgi:hypothetical protein
MTPERMQLQAQYANAVYEAERWAREAEIAGKLLRELARSEAESLFQGTGASDDAGERKMTKTPEIYRNELMNGLHSRLAKQLRVSRSHVYRVAQGERSSPRVDRALRNELQKIDRAVAKYESECKSVRSVAA